MWWNWLHRKHNLRVRFDMHVLESLVFPMSSIVTEVKESIVDAKESFANRKSGVFVHILPFNECIYASRVVVVVGIEVVAGPRLWHALS